MSEEKVDVLIIGGGTAGITVAAQLLLAEHPPNITILDPAPDHFYQPIWTLVGAGVFPADISRRAMADVIPSGVRWIQEHADRFSPDKNRVTTREGTTLIYDQLIVAAGIQLDWKEIKGLDGHLGKGGICSNYSFESVDSTWESIRSFQGGRALFTAPIGPYKCAGAPQKIMWLAEHAFRKRGVRNTSEIRYMNAGGAIFGIEKYRVALEKLVEARNIQGHYKQNLVAIKPGSNEAVFRHTESGEESIVSYDMIHITPPQSAPSFIKRSALAGKDAKGWVDVDKFTTQHNTFRNVFSLGDCSSLPCSKTGAAVRKQAPVTAANLMSIREGRTPKARYNGYASCPLVTGYGKVILAEFGYDGKIMETFPFDQAKERYSMYALKAHALPNLYWNGMLRGRL